MSNRAAETGGAAERWHEACICPRCRYPLRGTDAASCPECGESLEDMLWSVGAWHTDRAARPWKLWLWSIVLLVFLFAMLLIRVIGSSTPMACPGMGLIICAAQIAVLTRYRHRQQHGLADLVLVVTTTGIEARGYRGRHYRWRRLARPEFHRRKDRIELHLKSRFWPGTVGDTPIRVVLQCPDHTARELERALNRWWEAYRDS